MSTKEKQFKRKEILSNPKLQITIVGFFIFFFMVMCIILYSTNAYIFNQIDVLIAARPENSSLLTSINELHSQSNKIFIIAYLYTFFMMFVGGFLLSHRIAGPIYKMCKHLKMVNNNETTDNVYFRKGDYFKELQDVFNEHMKIYRNKLGIAERPTDEVPQTASSKPEIKVE